MQVYQISKTDIGNKRKINEDGTIFLTKDIGIDQLTINGIFDGMGGTRFGDVARDICFNSIREWWIQYNFVSMENIEKDLLSCILKVNDEIIHLTEVQGGTAGATCSILVTYKSQYLIYHIGDTRISAFFEGRLFQITRDDNLFQHKLENYYSEPFDITDKTAKRFLSKALGYQDVTNIQKYIGYIEKSCFFVLTTDGFHEYIAEEDYCSLLNKINNNLDNGEEVLSEMIELIKKHVAPDNITISLVSIVFKNL